MSCPKRKEPRVEFRVFTLRKGDDLAEVLLYLYRDGLLSQRKVLAVTTEIKAQLIMMMSRTQLFGLGYREYISSVSQTDGLRFGRIPQCSVESGIML